MRLLLSAAPVLALLLAATAAEAGPRRTVDCQKNMEDGRVLVDGRQAGDRRYRVLRYDMMRNEGLWSYGRCVIEYR